MTPLQPLLARSCGLLLLSTLAACAFVDDPVARAMRKVTPYRIEVVQGNFVSKEQVQALRPGMTRNQVKEILGTPLKAPSPNNANCQCSFKTTRFTAMKLTNSPANPNLPSA